MLCVKPFGKRERPYHLDKFKNSRIKVDSPLHIFYTDCFSSPNRHLTYLILRFLDPREVICEILYVSKSWRRVILSSGIWEYYHTRYGILSRITVNPLKILSQRRSKGKVYIGKYMCNSEKTKNNCEPVIVRVVDLEMTNGGEEDGVPTSSLREIATLQRIRHPNVIRYYGCQIVKSSLFIVTEFVSYNLREFMDLKRVEYKLIGYCKYLIRNEITSIILDLLRAIDYINERSVFHRNLKPENIFIETELMTVDSNVYHKYKSLKIGDFCMGRMTGLVSYSPEEPKDRCPSFKESRRLYYKPPEVILRSKYYDMAVDLWSVGVIFYEIVCNEDLFNAVNEISLIWEIFKVTGFPRHHDLPFLSETLYLSWDQITLKTRPIHIDDVIASGKREETYHELRMEYLRLNQLDHFDKLVKFHNIMGPEGTRLLFSLMELVPSNRREVKQMVENSNLWAFKYPVTPCNCTNDPKYCKFQREQLLFSPVKQPFLAPIPASKYLYPPTSNMISPGYHRCNEVDLEKECIVDLKLIYTNVVNWYFFVASRFKLSSSTVDMAIYYFLNSFKLCHNSKVNRVIGLIICCLKIAHRLNELSQEYYKCDNYGEYLKIASISKNISKIVAICSEKAYVKIPDREDLICCERQIFNLEGFHLSLDSLSVMVYDFGKLMEVDRGSSCFAFSCLLSDLCLYDIGLNYLENSLKAQVIWIISIYKFIIKPSPDSPNKFNSEFGRLKEIMKVLIESEGWYRGESILEVLRCVSIIEDIANVRSKKMKLDPDHNAVFRIQKVKLDASGVVHIPLQFVKILIQERLQTQLEGISEKILCSQVFIKGV